MKYLLTSGGVTTPTLRATLEELLGTPIEQASALCIPTAQWGHPACGPVSARGFLTGAAPHARMAGLGWRQLGLLELTALPTIDPQRWQPWVRDADVLLVDGGEATYLRHHLEVSGLADFLPQLEDTVWVGVSAGSMALTPRIGTFFQDWPDAPDDRGLGVVSFSIFPHLDVFPTNTLEAAHRWHAEVGGQAYVLDDASAVLVDGPRTAVVSDGVWHVLGAEDPADATL
ncbi:MAG: Type 1 glutamine amidotransferase-like domain-containing protein [Micrococcus sp.]|nr:Type 1 glutamine amidotransferase-like domain-containing protein [Micrococcus sp.]